MHRPPIPQVLSSTFIKFEVAWSAIPASHGRNGGVNVEAEVGCHEISQKRNGEHRTEYSVQYYITCALGHRHTIMQSVPRGC